MYIDLLITFMDKQDLNYKTVVLNIEISTIIKAMNKLFLTYQAGIRPCTNSSLRAHGTSPPR